MLYIKREDHRNRLTINRGSNSFSSSRSFSSHLKEDISHNSNNKE